MATIQGRLSGGTAGTVSEPSSERNSGARSRCLNDESVNAEVDRLLTFENCPELLRGSTLYDILRCCGQIFDSSSGSEVTYRLSEQVGHLDAFFSHNWSCPRIHKFLCLVFHFNLWPAFWLTVAYLCLLVAASILEWAPAVAVPDHSKTIGVLGHLTPVPVFWVLLFGYHEIVPRSHRRRIFLDKTCIHQEDKDIQRLGIEKLAAFLASADSVVVCYTPVYLRRLWTVYEAAAFLCLKDVECLHVIPYQLPWLFLAMTFVFAVYNVLGLCIRMSDVVSYLAFERLVLFVAAFFFAMACRQMGRAKADIKTTLAKFSVAECLCFDEQDRPVVHSNIVLLMRSHFDLPKETTDKEALSVFETLVGTLLPRAFAKSLGRGNVPYKYAAVVTTLIVGARFIDNLLGFVKDSYSLRHFLHVWGLSQLTIAISSGPLAFLTVDYCASCQLPWRKQWGIAWCLVSATAGFGAFLICYLPAWILAEAVNDYIPGDPWTEEQDNTFVALLIISVLQIIIVPILLSGSWRCVWRRFRKESEAEDQFTLGMSCLRDSVCGGPVEDQATLNDDSNLEGKQASPDAPDIVFMASHCGELTHL